MLILVKCVFTREHWGFRETQISHVHTFPLEWNPGYSSLNPTVHDSWHLLNVSHPLSGLESSWGVALGVALDSRRKHIYSVGFLYKGGIVDGSEIPFPTTVWMFLKPCSYPTSTGAGFLNHQPYLQQKMSAAKKTAMAYVPFDISFPFTNATKRMPSRACRVFFWGDVILDPVISWVFPQRYTCQNQAKTHNVVNLSILFETNIHSGKLT